MPSTRAPRSTLLATLHELAEADGPPGREEHPRRIAMRRLHPSMRRTRVSPLGSLYAERSSARGARWMLQASLDEPGFIVSHLDHAGIAWLLPSGRVDPDACSGASLRFPGNLAATLGVIAPPDGGEGPTRLLADLGTEGHADSVQIGTMGVFASPWREERTAVSGKALEGRLGAAIALEVAARTARSPNTLLLALTALGQVLHRAAPTAVVELGPDAAMALGAFAVPAKRTLGATRVVPGRGPVLLLRSEGYIADPRLVERVQAAATQARIPVQLAVGGEDLSAAGGIQSGGDGIPTVAVLVACSGVGTPRQQLEIRDLEAAVELLVRVLARPLELGASARRPR
jgi:putative aminopeptidase FrvX